jgi:preprotein translocase subunit Sec61beta
MQVNPETIVWACIAIGAVLVFIKFVLLGKDKDE